MIRAGRYSLVLLSAMGGVACHSTSDLLRKDGGTAGITGASGSFGGGGMGGGAAPDASPDVTPDVMPDGSPDAPPDPLPGYHWVALPAPFGAPMTTIALDSEGGLYAGTRTSISGLPMSGFVTQNGKTGLFKSSDGGASWRALDPRGLDSDVVALAAVGTTMYAGTTRLLRSTDGGGSWQEVAPYDFTAGYTNISGGGNTVAACSGGHLWISTDAGNTFRKTTSPVGADSVDVLENGAVILVAGGSGAARSTDGGVTFSAVQGVANGQGLGARFVCDGKRTCYGIAATSSKLDDQQMQLRSTDAGATWTSLGVANAGVLAISDTGAVYFVVGDYQMWRSDDAGVSMTEIVRPTTAGWFEPNCDGPLVARGDQVFAACPDGVYRSDDKGQRWRRASGSEVTGPITGAAAAIFVDASPTALGSDGDIYVNGLEGLAPDRTDNRTLKRSSDGGWTWETVTPTFFSDPCLVTPGGAIECLNVVTSTLRAGLARSDDHGVTWREVSIPAPLNLYGGSGLATDGTIVYLAAGGVARSTDDGRTFQEVPNDPGGVSLQVLRNGHLLVGRGSAGGGARSIDQGATWQTLPFLSALPVIEDGTGRLIRSVSGSKFEVSTDEGVTWSSLVSVGVPDIAVPTPAVLAADGAGHLFVFGPDASSDAKHLGPQQVFASTDGGAHFLPMPAQIPNPYPTSFATDKQGRLLVATLAGAFRLESHVDPGPPRPDGGTTDTPDGGGGPAPRSLSLVTKDGPWFPDAVGLAVDAAHHVYAADNYTVYVVDAAGTISSYLTRDEAAAAAGVDKYYVQIFDLDVGPDGKLYILLSDRVLSATPSTDAVMTSSAAHQATRLRNLAPMSLGRFAVIGAGRVGYFTSNEFWSATAAGTQIVYPATALGWDTVGCYMRDALIASSGAVAFLPGCDQLPIEIGSAAGAALKSSYHPNPDAVYGERFGCGAKDPAGGFYFMVTDNVAGRNPRLVHLPETVTSPPVPTRVATEPALGGADYFKECSMAVAPDGVLYVQAASRVWKVDSK